MPIFRYGLPIWLSNHSNSAAASVNSMLTKFLKMYLGLPQNCNNTIIYFLTQTSPLIHELMTLVPSLSNNLVFPPCLQGLQLSILKNITEPVPYCPIPDIPSTFWNSRVIHRFPESYRLRRLVCRDVTDYVHFDFICKNKKFHVSPEPSCVCELCGLIAHSYQLSPL